MFCWSRAKPKKAEDEPVRRRSMRLQRVEPSGAPVPEPEPEPEELVRGTGPGGIDGVCTAAAEQRRR